MRKTKKISSIVLATTIIASSAISAFAADSGIYVGNDMNKFYSLSDYIANKTQANGEMTTAGLGNTMYVDADNKITSLTELTEAGSMMNALREIQEGDLNTSYVKVDGTLNNPEEGKEAQGELKVESVSAINETGVDVTFVALTGDIEGATVVVKNSKGESVEVKPANLKKGEKVASFDFVTNVTETDLTGVWTVDGVEFSFNEQELVGKILEAAKGSSDVLAVEALENASIENLNVDLISGYKNAINEADPEPTSLKEIQSIVNTENSKFDKVKAVIDANLSMLGREVKVFNALKAGFENVESEWSEDYMNAFVKLADGSEIKLNQVGPSHYTGVTAVTYDELQETINRVAVEEIKELVIGTNGLYSSNEPKASDVSKAKTLLAKYSKLAYQVEDEITLGEYLEDLVTQLELMINVDKASTKASVKSALTRLGDFDATLVEKYDGVTTVNGVDPYASPIVTTTENVDTDFATAEFTDETNVDNGFAIIDANLDEYIKAFKQTAWASKNSVQNIVDVVIATNGTQETTLISELITVASQYDGGDSTKRPEFLKALQTVGAKRVVSNNLQTYADTSNGIVAAFAGLGAGDDIDDVQEIVDAANIFVVSDLATQNKSTELVNALKALDIKDLTVEAANKDHYLTAIQAITLGNSGAFDNSSVTADLTDIETAVKNANTAATTDASLKGFNEAATKSAAKTALDDLSSVTSLTAYSTIPAGDKEYIAGELLEARNKLTTGRTVLGTKAVQTGQKAKQFRTVGELVHYLTSNVDEVSADIDFNGDGNKTDTTNTTKGDTLISPIAKRSALIAGVNGIQSNVAGVATTLSLDVSDASVDNTVTYTSDNESIATVDSDGAVSFVAGTEYDTVNITATVNGTQVDTQELTVNSDGDGFTTEYTQVDNTVTYASSDEDKATVDSEGTVTAVAVGTANITAEVNSVTVKTTAVTVTSSSNPVEYEDFLLTTATTFKALEVPGFSKASKPVSSADIALVEKYFNSEAFYSLAEANASNSSVTAGDLKVPFKTVSEILGYLK